MLLEYRLALENPPPSADVRIEWDLFAGHPFRVQGPRDVDLLQLADLCASSIYQAVEPGMDGPRYLKAFGNLIYRKSPPITSYGLKVFPAREAEPGGALHFLRSII